MNEEKEYLLIFSVVKCQINKKKFPSRPIWSNLIRGKEVIAQVQQPKATNVDLSNLYVYPSMHCDLNHQRSKSG